jgi:hypothetical protein
MDDLHEEWASVWSGMTDDRSDTELASPDPRVG